MELSESYTKEKENFDKELKINQLKDRNKKLQKDLENSNAQLRQERMRNQELTKYIQKIKKKISKYNQGSGDEESEGE